MLDTEPHPLLAEVGAYCAANGLSKSAFGERAVGDPRFVFDLEAGREPRRKTIARARDFITTGVTWADLKAERGAA